jgi:hypothetical protein
MKCGILLEEIPGWHPELRNGDWGGFEIKLGGRETEQEPAQGTDKKTVYMSSRYLC